MSILMIHPIKLGFQIHFQKFGTSKKRSTSFTSSTTEMAKRLILGFVSRPQYLDVSYATYEKSIG